MGVLQYVGVLSLARPPVKTATEAQMSRRPAPSSSANLPKVFTTEMVEKAYSGHSMDRLLKDTLVKGMPEAELEAAAALMDKAKDTGNVLARAGEFELADMCYTDAVTIKATEEYEELRTTLVEFIDEDLFRKILLIVLWTVTCLGLLLAFLLA